MSVKLDPRHAASVPVIEAVQRALDEGLVVGLMHPTWAGPSACAFTSLEAYLATVRESDPGNLFTLWSVPDLTRRGILLFKGDSGGLSSVHEWLSAQPLREYLAVAVVGGMPEALLGGIEEFEALKDLSQRADPCGEFAVLPLSELLDGVYSPRLHIVNAECANERGEVPADKSEASRIRRR